MYAIRSYYEVVADVRMLRQQQRLDLVIFVKRADREFPGDLAGIEGGDELRLPAPPANVCQ